MNGYVVQSVVGRYLWNIGKEFSEKSSRIGTGRVRLVLRGIPESPLGAGPGLAFRAEQRTLLWAPEHGKVSAAVWDLLGGPRAYGRWGAVARQQCGRPGLFAPGGQRASGAGSARGSGTGPRCSSPIE
ncbi:hypothetical protein H8959_002594 [Pygathrix nigripes]